MDEYVKKIVVKKTGGKKMKNKELRIEKLIERITELEQDLILFKKPIDRVWRITIHLKETNEFNKITHMKPLTTKKTKQLLKEIKQDLKSTKLTIDSYKPRFIKKSEIVWVEMEGFV